MESIQEWYFDDEIPLIQNTELKQFGGSFFSMSICGFTEIDNITAAGALIFKIEFKPTMPVQLLEEVKVRIRTRSDILAGGEGIEILLTEWDFAKKAFISYVQGTSKFFEDSTIELMMLNIKMGEYEPITQDTLPVATIMDTWERRLSIPNTKDYLEEDDDFVFNDDYTDEADPDLDNLEE